MRKPQNWLRNSRPKRACCEASVIFCAYLETFAEGEPLRERLLKVLHALPADVQRDFLDDPRFRVAKEQHIEGRGTLLWMDVPGPIGSSSRCVVLRGRLNDCSEAFACYVIAHEFAHAYLRNGGWNEISDREEAADALAAFWGFARPENAWEEYPSARRKPG